MGVFLKCISSGKYDESKVLLTTYAVPFIGGAKGKAPRAEKIVGNVLFRRVMV